MLTAVPPVSPRKDSTSSFSSRSVRFGRRDDTLVLHKKKPKQPFIDRYAERYTDRFLNWFKNWMKETLKSIKGLMLIPLSFGVAIVAALGVSALSNAFNAPPKGKRAILPAHLANSPAVSQAASVNGNDAIVLTLQDGQSYDLGNYAGGLYNPWLSQKQIKITRSGGDYFIQDLNSRHKTYIPEAGGRWKQLVPNEQVPLAPGTPLMMGREVFVFNAEDDEQSFARIALTQSRKFAETGRIPFDESILEGLRVTVDPNISFHYANGAPTQSSNREIMWILTEDLGVGGVLKDLDSTFSKKQNQNWNDLQKLVEVVRSVKQQLPAIDEKRLDKAMRRRLAQGTNKNLSLKEMIEFQRNTFRRFCSDTSKQQFRTVSLERALLAKSLVDRAFANDPDGLEMELVRYKNGFLNRIRLNKDIKTPTFFLRAGTELLVDCMSGRICTMDSKEVRSYEGNNKKPVYATESPHPPRLVRLPGGTAVQVATTFNTVVPEP